MQVSEMLARVAVKMQALPWKTVYVGGATTHLLVTDSTAPLVSPTVDVDVLVDIESPVEFQVQLSQALRALGAKEDTSEGAPLCRWIVGEVTVDVMSPNSSVLGFSNSWYPEVLAQCEEHQLKGTSILLIDALSFLATKIEAFEGRGKGDFLASKDVEDIIAVLDGRPELLEEMRERSPQLKEFIAEHLEQWIANPDFEYAMQGYLQENVERIPLLKNRITQLIAAAR